MAVYMLLESVGRSPYIWEAPTDCALGGDSLHACASVSPVKKRLKRVLKRYAVKRSTPFCTGQLRTGFLSYVYRFVSTVQV